jgi:hypothetical protein
LLKIGSYAQQLSKWLSVPNFLNGLKPIYEKATAFAGRSGDRRAPEKSTNLRSRTSSGKLSGWKGDLHLAAMTTGAILVANVIFTIVVVAPSTSGVYFATVSTGTCKETHRANTILHFIINILELFCLQQVITLCTSFLRLQESI